jgi:hypothetical protein
VTSDLVSYLKLPVFHADGVLSLVHACHSTGLVLRNVVYVLEIPNEYLLVKRFQQNAHVEIVQIP